MKCPAMRPLGAQGPLTFPKEKDSGSDKGSGTLHLQVHLGLFFLLTTADVLHLLLHSV